MSRFWDNWAYAYRNARAWGAVAMLLIVLFFVWVTAPGELVSSEHQTGIVIEVSDGDNDFLVGLVGLKDGRQAHILLQRPKPFPGDSIPLRVETYADGATLAYLDVERWRMP